MKGNKRGKKPVANEGNLGEMSNGARRSSNLNNAIEWNKQNQVV
jgi:hypothetical protein